MTPEPQAEVMDEQDRAAFMAAMSKPEPKPELEPEPEPAPTPAPEPAKPEPPAVDIDALIGRFEQQQQAALVKLEEVSSKFIAERRAEGSEATEESLFQDFVQNNPEAEQLVRFVEEQRKELSSLRMKLDEMESERKYQQDVAQQRERLVIEARDLLQTHNVAEADLLKVLEWAADEKNEAAADALTFREMAGRVLGHDALEAMRRRPPANGTPKEEPKPETERRAAKIVTDTAPGTGALPPPVATPGAGTGDALHDEIQSILRNEGHRLGKFS